MIRRDGAYALVRIEDEGCGRCHEPGGCGGSALTRAFCSSGRIYRAQNPGGAEPGDEVVVEIPDRALRHSIVAGYLFPLLCLFLGATLGMKLAGEAGSMSGALGGLLVAWGLQRIRRARDFFPSLGVEPRIKTSRACSRSGPAH
jgi:sigma-E factor negative regulatory protein RseC